MNKTLKLSVIFGGTALLGTVAQASTDYGPAIWHPICNANWYTSGYGHKFHVIHDMEGYYASTVAWFDNCSMSSASVHYAINGKKDATSDAPEGEITQLGVREANYAWHACCWNKHSTGTEHEGFASNPAWYTEAMYQASALLTRHLADKFGYAKDRNHIVGHGEKSSSAWVTWANANLGINATCNSHTDPGPNWDWSHYMALIAGNGSSVVSASFPSSVGVGQGFSATIVMKNTGGTSWTSAGNYNLGSQNPQDNTRWGLGRVGTTGTISPNQNSTYTFNCTAPTTAGSYAFDWKMVQDGVEWFGATSSGGINVTANLASAIVDNSDAGFSVTGTWATGSSSTDKYGADYRYHSTAAVSEPAQWVANLANTGTYAVYAWWPAGANRSTSAPYVVYYNGGNVTVPKNQQSAGGAWNLLGTWAMNAGNNTVKLSCWTGTGFNVMADAIKWQQQ